MRVLLFTFGTRGDVEPVVALATELRSLGQDVHICVPPDFRDWIEGLGFPFTPVGPEVRPTASAERPTATPEQLSRAISDTVADQFNVIPVAARGCDVIVGCGAWSIAARSVAEQLGIGYVYVSYCPVTLPSPHHAPLLLPGQTPPPETADNGTLWAENLQRWNDIWREHVNSHRAAVGLDPLTEIRGHMFTARPWLAADPTLGPWLRTADLDVVQTGAWMAQDQRPLSDELEKFLAAGEAPIYFGFGSTRAPEDLAKVMISSARALGHRAILARGWADLSLADDEPDCLSIGEVNLQALFDRVAVAVHHGGAGTTTAASLAGAPQVLVPQQYDQPYWAQQIDRLGIGVAHSPDVQTVDSLTAALRKALQPDVAVRAKAVAAEVRPDGAKVAAQRLIALDAQKHEHADQSAWSLWSV